MLKTKGYVDAETNDPLPECSAQLRKITFFLVLNSDASYKYDLMTDHTVSHLLNAFPPLSKCLLLACIWGLALDKFLYECIAFTPIWFAFTFVEDAVESLKYADPYETLDRVDHLVRAIYTNIARSDYRPMETVEKKIVLNKYFDVTMDLLRHFFSPDADGFENWSKRKKYKYTGYVLKHNLGLLLHCFDVYQHKPLLKHTGHCIYTLMREREPLVDNMRENYSDAVADTLHRLNTTILNSLQNNVMHVDCNAFMYWVEIDIDADTTLQRLVGEAAYRIEQMINLNECFQHDVGAQLKTIAIKPRTVEERATQSTIGELIDKLERLQNDDEHIGLWLREFIARGELVLGNVECLEALELHAQTLTADNIRQLIAYAASVDIDNGCVVEEKLIECCLTAFDHLSEATIVDLIQFSIEQQQQHFSYMQLDNFDSFLIEVFNKTSFVYDRKIYLKLLFQSPQLFYDKLFREALTTEVQMSQMVEILRVTAKVFKTFLGTHLNALIETKCDTNDRLVAPLVPKLIAQLFHLNVIEPAAFIIDNIYKKYFVPALQSKNLPRIALIINALLLSVQQKYSFDGFAAPILVMSAQIIELCRWTVISFDEGAVTVVTKTIDFVQEVLKKFLPTANEKDKKWILSKIGAYAPLTKFYFQKLSLTKEQPIERFVGFLRPTATATASDCRQSGIQFLCEHVVRCTTKEIKWLAENDELLPQFHEAMRLITTIVDRSKNKPEIDCLRYCCNSYFGIVEVNFIIITCGDRCRHSFSFLSFYSQTKLVPIAETEDAQADLLVEVLRLLNQMHELSLYNETILNCHPLLSAILTRCTLSDGNKTKIESEIDQLADCAGKTLLSQKFSELK